MKPKTILRLLKAVLFTLLVLTYGYLIRFLKGFWATLVFAALLALFLRELYKGEKK